MSPVDFKQIASRLLSNYRHASSHRGEKLSAQELKTVEKALIQKGATPEVARTSIAEILEQNSDAFELTKAGNRYAEVLPTAQNAQAEASQSLVPPPSLPISPVKSETAQAAPQIQVSAPSTEVLGPENLPEVVVTAKKLVSFEPASDLKFAPGKVSADVEKLQGLLNEYADRLGFEKLKEDGRFGPKTQAAVEAFQREFKVTGDTAGVVGKETAARLQDLARYQQTAKEAFSFEGTAPSKVDVSVGSDVDGSKFGTLRIEYPTPLQKPEDLTAFAEASLKQWNASRPADKQVSPERMEVFIDNEKVFPPSRAYIEKRLTQDFSGVVIDKDGLQLQRPASFSMTRNQDPASGYNDYNVSVTYKGIVPEGHEQRLREAIEERLNTSLGVDNASVNLHLKVEPSTVSSMRTTVVI